MPSLLDIKARIKAVENIKKITRAMQLVAAAKFNRSQGRARSARPYSDELAAVLGVLAAISEDDYGSSGDSMLDLAFVDGEEPLRVDQTRLFDQKQIKRPGIVLFTAVEVAIGGKQHFRRDLTEAIQHAAHAEVR